MLYGTAYNSFMENNYFHQNQEPVGDPQPIPGVGPRQNEIDFTPSPDEVARRAEAELIQERHPIRVHFFHKRA